MNSASDREIIRTGLDGEEHCVSSSRQFHADLFPVARAIASLGVDS
ncbi:MAG TPA: hypothetical protein V6D29_09860 [Leptolyngbyaceae cyanobacterium]